MALRLWGSWAVVLLSGTGRTCNDLAQHTGATGVAVYVSVYVSCPES